MKALRIVGVVLMALLVAGCTIGDSGDEADGTASSSSDTSVGAIEPYPAAVRNEFMAACKASLIAQGLVERPLSPPKGSAPWEKYSGRFGRNRQIIATQCGCPFTYLQENVPLADFVRAELAWRADPGNPPESLVDAKVACL